MNNQPTALSNNFLNSAKYLVFDGTYFHKDGCLAIVFDYQNKVIISSEYIERESFHSVYPVLLDLKNKGLNPIAITVDGHLKVIDAIKTVWPDIIIQRCLFHIMNQALMWIRSYPKTQAGKDLRLLAGKITWIKTDADKNQFINDYSAWNKKYSKFIKTLDSSAVAFKDLKRTRSLINNAFDDMFHFIKDQNIASTTNILEGLFSQVKHQYRSHRGLSRKHKISFLIWFCYYKNRLK